MEKAIVFPAGRGMPNVVDVPDDMDYRWMGDKVGGWIEIVHPARLPHGFVMIVDEEGRISGKPLNPVGSWFYGYDLHGEPIVGDVLIMREVMGPDGPECAGMSEDDVNAIFDSLGKE